jgi:hypothetical protein
MGETTLPGCIRANKGHPPIEQPLPCISISRSHPHQRQKSLNRSGDSWVSCGYPNFSSVAVLVQPADCDSSIVSLIIENRRTQRDGAMLLYFLVPWILVTLLLASPCPTYSAAAMERSSHRPETAR